MVKKHIPHRLGATAIAAVLALSSGPLSAQVVDTLAPAADPVPVDTPISSDPIAPAPLTEPTPVPAATEPASVADETPQPAATTQPAKAKPVRTTVARQVAPQSSADSAALPASAAAFSETPAAAPPVPADAPMAEPVTDMVPAAPVTESASFDSDLPLIAGGAGLAAIALLGTGIVASRRRRRRDEMVVDQVQIDQPSAEPRIQRQPSFAPVAKERSAFAWGQSDMAASPARHLPRGFDLSRFGRHVQAAYRGPTPDNPSLSLRKRLKRASFFDMKERQARGSGLGMARSPEFMPA